MDRGQAPGMPGVERLNQIKRFGATHLTEHDAIRTHTQRVAQKVTNLHGPHPFNAVRPSLQTHHMGMAEPKLGRILDGDHTSFNRHMCCQSIEQRGLTGARTATDDDAAPVCDQLR